MLLSLALIFLCGLLFGKLFHSLKLPHLLGMLLVGILLGPYGLNLLDESILNISTELRQIALVIILTRAGLNLDLNQLKKVGRPAILMCFLPACIEILCITLLAPILFTISHLEALLIGTILAAVSPAVIVPKMLKLIERKWGTDKAIPHMIMASASVDDVFVIVLFTITLGLLESGSFHISTLLQLPTSLILGVIGGFVIGLLLIAFFKKFHIRDSIKILIILSICFLGLTLEGSLSGVIAFSGLLAIMTLGATMRAHHPKLSERLSSKYSKLWVAAEPMLFVLVGAQVDTSYIANAGLAALALIFIATLFRICGAWMCTYRTTLDKKERIFVAFSYIPKATVQAAIGGIPLAAGLSVGNLALTTAVLSILFTAPIGSFLIDKTYKKCLKKAH